MDLLKTGHLKVVNILKKQNIFSVFNYYAFLGFSREYNDYQSSILLVELMYEELQNSSNYYAFLNFAKKNSFLKSTYTSLERLGKLCSK